MSMLISLSLAAPEKRLSETEFLKLGTSGQKRYLTAYPNSKHRFLLKKKLESKRAARKEARKVRRLPKAEPAKLRKLRKAEYQALDAKGKAAYDARFPKNGHKERFRKGRAPKQGKTVLDGGQTPKEARDKRKEDTLKVDVQRNTMHDEGAGTINKQSVQALAKIKPEQLHQGAANISSNREEIHSLVADQMKDRPNLFGRGLASVRDMMQGHHMDDDVLEGEYTEVNDDVQADDEDGNPLNDENGKPISKKAKKQNEAENGPDPSQSEDDDDEDDEEDDSKSKKKKKKKKKGKDKKKKRDGHAVLNAVIKTALLGAGIGLLAMGAGPLGMVIGRGLLDLWTDFQAAAAADPEKTQEELDHDTVDEIITQTVSYMRNMDMHDLHDHSKEMFSALAASPADLYGMCFNALLPFVSERPRGRPGKNFFGGTNVDVATLASVLERVLGDAKVLRTVEHELEGTDDVYLFYCKDAQHTLIALGTTSAHGLYHVAFLNW